MKKKQFKVTHVLQINSQKCCVRKVKVFDVPRSPSVTVPPEPRAAWKAQRRTEECVPSSDKRRRKTVAHIYGDKVNAHRHKSLVGLEQQ